MAFTSNQMKSSTPSFFDCSICFEAYDLTLRSPVVGICGHTICATCRDRLQKKCPICQNENAFQHEVKNFSLMEIIEDKINREKHQKAIHACSICHTNVDDVDCHVCLTCVQMKCYDSLQNLCDEINSNRMCSNCTNAIQTHDGHGTHGLNEAKDSLKSMQLQSALELCANYSLPLLDGFQAATEIANETYKDFYKTLLENGRMTGIDARFNELLETTQKDLIHQHRMLTENTGNLWKFTQSCLNTMQSRAKQMEQFKARSFTPAEEQIFRALRARIRRRVPEMKVETNRISMDDWRKMTMDEKYTKTLEMVQTYRNRDAAESDS